MNKKIKLTIFFLLIVLFVTGCYSKEEKKLAKQYEKEGKTYAINYIKEKYGFTPKVKSAKSTKNCSSVWGCIESKPSGNVEVTFTKDNSTFTVMVYGLDEKKISAADNYQHEEIKADLVNYFKTIIPFALYDYKVNIESLITEYYNSNLEKILKHIKEVELYYIAEDNLNTLNLQEIENFWKNDYNLKLINFKTLENYKRYKNVNFENMSLTTNEMKNIYIDNMINIKNQKTEYYQINNITNYNDEIFIYAKDFSIHEISLDKIEDLNNYRKLYPELNDKKIEQLTNTYKVLSSPSVLYFYFPKDKVNVKDTDNVFFIHECYTNQEKKYYIDYYFGLESKMKLGSDGNYYIILKNFSSCDLNSEVIFSLIKIS